jgi:hypothetical protein
VRAPLPVGLRSAALLRGAATNSLGGRTVVVPPEQFQLFDFHVLKQWPATKVARKLGVSLGQVYFAKYKVSKLMKKEIRQLRAQEG